MDDASIGRISDSDYSAQVVVDLTSVIHASPEDGRAYFNRGNAYLDLGDMDRAIIDYTRTIELDPADSVAYNNLGVSYRRKSEADTAIADFTKAIELDPGYRDAYNNRGMARSDRREYEAAVVGDGVQGMGFRVRGERLLMLLVGAEGGL